MPRWASRTEGGSWFGGGTEVRDCNPTQVQAIENAFNNFINLPCLDCFPGLRDCLRRTWDTIQIDCTGFECNDVSGRQFGGTVWVCDTSAGQVGPVLLHELVHACGGGELDSVAAENSCFFGNGALDPSAEWDTIRSGTSALDGDENIRVGQFAIWDTRTGDVWGRSRDGNGRIVRGPRCFQRNNWIHAYRGGGGWL